MTYMIRPTPAESTIIEAAYLKLQIEALTAGRRPISRNRWLLAFILKGLEAQS